jgi:hypothetical protein
VNEWYVLVYESRYCIDATGQRIECNASVWDGRTRCTFGRSTDGRWPDSHRLVSEWIPDITITRSHRGILQRATAFANGSKTSAQRRATGNFFLAILDLTTLIAMRPVDAKFAGPVIAQFMKSDPEKRFLTYEQVMEAAAKAAASALTEISTVKEEA